MRFAVFFFMLCIWVPMAFAQSAYEVTCDNVTDIELYRYRAKDWRLDTSTGYIHVLVLRLKAEGAEEFMLVRDNAPHKSIEFCGKEFLIPDLMITAKGQELPNDSSALTGFANHSISLAIVGEEDAFAAARLVCQERGPDQVLAEGRYAVPYHPEGAKDPQE